MQRVCNDSVPKPQQPLGRYTNVPRAIWTGSISFGLVNVPVRMYSAIDEHDLHFNLIHERDDSRIGYQKICKKEEKPVPDDEIVKAYEFVKDEFVVLDDDDFEAVKSEGVKSIDISDFVPYDEIDPDLLRAHLLPGAAVGQREGLRAPPQGDGGDGARRRSRSSSCATASTSAACGCAMA